ncbi:putative Phospholipase D/transphosphatidylase Pld [Pseudodesulfovibrio profundus]|uniref:Putative Phospholipase D/transphosphatidylase Pld n=1 Tax=Pseudodesulfovibrio profundus TaxID=57320 RepID=A0A2C8F653_9BACT|nr:VTT domain-containing protein [Pseudodesulfovibrio profundus]SOB57982.1 putative Phospholipase D/transphosphatidylase Pld [Pseudodesulfovibrio profundus]
MEDKDDILFTPEGATMAEASRAAFLVDACAYFSALSEAIRNAERSILIAGWDIDSRIKLDPVNSDEKLYELLNKCVEERPDLHIHVLIWDYPLAYSLDREPMQQLNFPLKTHENIHYQADSALPLGSSHHQKIVVIDDKIAFVGGIDLTAGRWDRPGHPPFEEHRVKPDGSHYLPYHDIQMLIEGEPVARIGDIVRKRWEWATDEELSPPQKTEGTPWPASVDPDMENENVVTAMTLPAFRGRQARREVESLYLHQIARAKKTIYIENQYFTSTSIRDALIERLQSHDCPEILIILPQMTTGLLEQLVMEPLQSEVLDTLAEQDKHNKLAVYCPFGDEDSCIAIKVHSKIMIIDDEFITVGSANLNDRSMGLDSECNLAFGSKEITNTLAHFRHRLMAHHIGIPMDQVTDMEPEKGMLGTVEELSRPTGRLVIEPKTRNENPLPVDPELIREFDTSHPGEYDTIMDDYSSSENSERSYLSFMGFGAILAGFIILALLWRFTPLSEYATPDALLHWAEQVQKMPMSPVLAILCFVVGGFILFPVTLLIVLTASIFSPVMAFFISLAGCLASALSVYYVGELLGHKQIKRLAGSKVKEISERLGKHGLASIVVTRVVPVAPYSVINLVAGASHIKLSTFLLGTVLGMGPGIVAMTLFGAQLINTLRNPGPGTLAILIGIVLLVVVAGTLVRRRLKRMRDDSDSTEESQS